MTFIKDYKQTKLDNKLNDYLFVAASLLIIGLVIIQSLAGNI